MEDGDPAENNSDPEAAGDAFLSSFSFTITENTASIRLPVLDDFVQEDDATFTYSPALESAVESGYLVDPDVNSGTFTLTEGVEPATSPTIGVTVGSTTLIRDEQTVMELTFTSEGDIPAEGVVVLLERPPKGFAEFDFSEPINITGGTIVGTDDIASTLSLLITDPQIRRVRVVRRADGYYCQFLIDVERQENHKPTGQVTGIDLGLKEFYTDAQGNTVDNPRYLRKSEKRLKKAQRRLSKRFRKGKKQSNNYHKQRVKVAKLHLKVSRQRKDKAIKDALALVQSNDLVVYEALKIRNLVRNAPPLSTAAFLLDLKSSRNAAAHSTP
ncbi:Transposase [Crocosphaera watsonii WH 0401]|uniref:Transposase n=1 Tax=Crocosphaera watsonii WH 0401 TaxID=555881 RepID=T2JH81_CROWT|nr:Transposase [Crocosphaera watsonii WH 0401]